MRGFLCSIVGVVIEGGLKLHGHGIQAYHVYMRRNVSIFLSACTVFVVGCSHDAVYTVDTENFRLYTLAADAAVTGSVTIEGEARAWYFEGSFPVELYNASGALIQQTFAQAQQDWMTTDWVPFVAQLTVPPTSPQSGTLIFKKDNPSDDPALDQQYRLSVQLNASADPSLER